MKAIELSSPHKRCVRVRMILKEGQPFAALGLKGGHVQPQVKVQIITNLIDFGMTVQEAIAAPRFNHIEGVKLGLEPGIAEASIQELKSRGHQIVSATPESFDGAHAIMINPESGAFSAARTPQRRLRHRVLNRERFRPTAETGAVSLKFVK
jgi:gamma-glutamyltranspeptidase/glutathione hydrolase